MSACSASEVRRIGSVLLALFGLAALASPGSAKTTTTRDTSVTRSVTVDEHGVTIEREKTEVNGENGGKVTVRYDLDQDDPSSPYHGRGLVVMDDSGAGMVRVFSDA